MHDSEKYGFVDQVLDAALAGYTTEKPRAGLEQRILARLAEQPQPPAWPARRWLPAGALALVALMALAILLPRRESAPTPVTVTSQPPQLTATQKPAPRAPAPAVVPIKRAPQPSPRATHVTAAQTRAAQFPRPGSLTEEERLLMRYLETVPREVLVASVRGQGPLSDLQVGDVEVPMIELKPLPEQSGEAMEN